MKMQIGMIGLGRMGAGMATRLWHSSHECLVHDRAPQGIARRVALGATGAAARRQLDLFGRGVPA